MLHIDPPSQPLSRSIVIANLFRARVFHIGQPERVLSCSRCLETGHHSSRCTNEVKCKNCKQFGHISSSCPDTVNTATPSELRNIPADCDARDSVRNPADFPADCNSRDSVRNPANISKNSSPREQAAADTRSKNGKHTSQKSDDVITPAQKSRHQTHITGFLHTATPLQNEEQNNSTDAAEGYDTDDGSILRDSDIDEFQSPLSPESPTPTKTSKKPPKRKRKEKRDGSK